MSLKRAITAIQKLYPLKYADSSWDNTGLLLDSSTALSTSTSSSSNTSILLTIDLTKSVVEEAIANNVQLIIAYHPFIFRGIKRIEPLTNPQHDSLIKLITNGISVYSPHTAIDAAHGGVNDWLVEGVADVDNVDKKQVIEPNSSADLSGNNMVGMGRYVTLKTPMSLKEIVERVKKHLGLEYLQLATKLKSEEKIIKTIAVCAGSGGSVFGKLSSSMPVDLYLTGELSHHEVLHYKEAGSSVIVTNHSNSERGYLQVVKQLLEEELGGVNIVVSTSDCDPYQTV